ncbi:MAG: hypothetical protein SYR96_32360, partial [Actinomycetota bacterium]|nr:hypothetical protein [Actinomycetota bacterium]
GTGHRQGDRFPPGGRTGSCHLRVTGEGVAAVAAAATQDVREPCSTQVAVQPVGTTCTFIRRRQSGQKRGGSSSRAAAHAA